MTDLSRDIDPDQPTKGHSGEGVNSADHVDNKDMDALKPEARQEALLDEAVDETFPASDPVSVKRIT
jgi:hypothetical protein